MTQPQYHLEGIVRTRNEGMEDFEGPLDVIFLLLTKRPERIPECLPADWGAGWDNIFLNVTVENQKKLIYQANIWLAK